ncbi:hypothetical protein I3760_08G135900 [Carya illinoinensis]|nr:hypothetical protein I3760_08G135900 [Carya illinoinensis]
MGFGSLRTLIRPLSRTLIRRTSTRVTTTPFPATFTSPESVCLGPLHRLVPWFPISTHFHSLTDARFPKRRPSDRSRRKRASLKPPGPYAWVQYTPGERIPPSSPNEGSVKRRNEKKRIKQHRAFILSEKKKRKAQLQEANRKKIIKRVERKMAAVARERAWAQRLAELQQQEEEKKRSMA